MTNSFLIPLTIWHENNSQGCATPRFAGGDGVCSPHELWNTGSFHSKSHSSYWRHFGDFVMLYILIIVKRINAWLRVTHRAFFEASLSLPPPPMWTGFLIIFGGVWRERERARDREREREEQKAEMCEWLSDSSHNASETASTFGFDSQRWGDQEEQCTDWQMESCKYSRSDFLRLSPH